MEMAFIADGMRAEMSIGGCGMDGKMVEMASEAEVMKVEMEVGGCDTDGAFVSCSWGTWVRGAPQVPLGKTGIGCG